MRVSVGEFALVPEMGIAFGRLARTVREIVDGLIVDEEALTRNLHHHGGLVASEAVMMALAEHVGKTEAHHILHGAAETAMSTDGDFATVLKENNRVTEHLLNAEIDTLTDSTNYVDVAGEPVDHTLEGRPDRS